MNAQVNKNIAFLLDFKFSFCPELGSTVIQEIFKGILRADAPTAPWRLDPCAPQMTDREQGQAYGTLCALTLKFSGRRRRSAEMTG